MILLHTVSAFSGLSSRLAIFLPIRGCILVHCLSLIEVMPIDRLGLN